MGQQTFFRAASGYAMQHGLALGLWWIVGMVCFFNSFTTPLCNTAFALVFFSSPFVAGALAVRFCRVYNAADPVSYGGTYVYLFLLYFYATVLLTAAVYVYFAYIDHGRFLASYMAFLDRPDVAQALSQSRSGAGPTTDVAALKRMLQGMQGVGATTYAMMAFNMNIIAGSLIAVPTAWVARRWINRKKR